MPRQRVIYSGEPGTTWTNETGKVQYQLQVNWQNSCGLCGIHDGQIGPSWPIPFHRSCRCHQLAIWPGATSEPFTDFRETIDKLDHVQQSRVVGRSNLTLIERGVVTWEDVVTRARVRDFREVVANAKLGLKDLVKAGVNPRIAAEALTTIHTPAHDLAAARRAELLAQLTAKGIAKADLKRALAERLAARVGIRQGPSGPGSSPITPSSPTPKPSPKPVPIVPAVARKKKPTPPFPLPIPAIAGGSPDETQKAYLESLGVKAGSIAEVQAFPKSLDSLRFVRPLGGSTGAELIEDPATGRQYVHKTGASPGHLREETHADAAYRALGVPVPASKLYEHAGKPVKLSEYHEGVSLGSLQSSDPAAYAAAVKTLRKDFVADALLGNWDVVGQDLDNVLVTRAGDVLRIDNGGALRYRAQGAKKSASQWSGDLGELQSMRSKAVNPSAAKVFAGVTDDEIRAQAAAILARQDVLLAAVPAELRETLTARLGTLAAIAGKTPARVGATVVPAPEVFRTFDTPEAMDDWGKPAFQGWAKNLSRDQKKSLVRYSSELFEEMNGALRGTLAPRDLVDGRPRPIVTESIAHATAALKQGVVPEAVTTYRGIADVKSLGLGSLDQLAPGVAIDEKGFTSTTLNADRAVRFAVDSDLENPAPAVFRIEVPAGSTGGYLNAGELSEFRNEKELLFPPDAKYVVAGHGTPIEHDGKMVPVVVLKRVK